MLTAVDSEYSDLVLTDPSPDAESFTSHCVSVALVSLSNSSSSSDFFASKLSSLHVSSISELLSLLLETESLSSSSSLLKKQQASFEIGV